VTLTAWPTRSSASPSVWPRSAASTSRTSRCPPSPKFVAWSRTNGMKTWARSIPGKTIPPPAKSKRKPNQPMTPPARATRH
jgi:hypothetical protein